MTPTQTVIYSLDETHEPTWQYYSMPQSIVGGGESLDAARSHYRVALQFALDVAELPHLREHLELPAAQGIWMRIPVEHPSPEAVIEDLACELAAHPADREWFLDQRTAGGYPVVALGVPNEPVSAILEQMTEFDSLIVGFVHGSPGAAHNVWLSVNGARAERRSDEPLASFGSLGVTPQSLQQDLLDAAVRNHVNRLSALVA